MQVHLPTFLLLAIIIVFGTCANTDDWKPVKRRPTHEYVPPTQDRVYYWQRRPSSSMEYQQPPPAPVRTSIYQQPVPPFMLLPPSLKESSYLELWSGRDPALSNVIEDGSWKWNESNRLKESNNDKPTKENSGVLGTHQGSITGTSLGSMTDVKIGEISENMHGNIPSDMSALLMEEMEGNKPSLLKDSMTVNMPGFMKGGMSGNMNGNMAVYMTGGMHGGNKVMYMNHGMSNNMISAVTGRRPGNKPGYMAGGMSGSMSGHNRPGAMFVYQPIATTTERVTTTQSTTTTEDPALNVIEPMQLIIEGHSKVRKYGATYFPFEIANHPIFKQETTTLQPNTEPTIAKPS